MCKRLSRAVITDKQNKMKEKSRYFCTSIFCFSFCTGPCFVKIFLEIFCHISGTIILLQYLAVIIGYMPYERNNLMKDKCDLSKANKSIKCSVQQCEHHCKNADYCSLDEIKVVTHEANPTETRCTDCNSFVPQTKQ